MPKTPEIYCGPDQAEPNRSAVTLIDPPPAWTDVLAERQRQIEVEGWTPAHDDTHDRGELAGAGSAYAMSAAAALRTRSPAPITTPPPFFPFAAEYWKPTTARRDLIKAAALLLAEIERLDRTAGNT